MAVAYVASATGTGTTTVTKPTGLSVGDVLIVACVDNVSGLSISGSTFLDLGQTNIVTTNYLHLFARVIDGTESSSFTASSATNYEAIGYSGVTGLPAHINGWSSPAVNTSPVSRYRAPVAGTVIHVFAAAGTGTITLTSPGSPTTDRGGFTPSTFWGLNISEEAVSASDDNTRTATISTGLSVSSVTKALMLPTAASVPARVGSATNSANSTNASVTIPTDAAIGDLFVCAFQVTGNAGTISAGPTGFTALDGPGSHAGGTQKSNYWWGYKVLASGDPGSSVHVTSGSQVWASAGVVIRNVNTTPVASSGTMANSTGSTASLVAASTAGGAKIAVSALMFSGGSGGGGHVIDVATIPGVAWSADTTVFAGWGGVGLAVQGVPAAGAALAPNVALTTGTPVWQTNTALLDLPASSGATGTLATTLDGATLAASGTETISGALASTLTGSTLAASGTVANPVTGTLATTLAGATLAGAGTETITGTLASTLDGATLASSGTETISGALATTLAGATLAASGTETISGTLATTLDGATLSASGTAGATGVTGTLSTTLAGATLAATGIETITGTASVQLDGATLSALATEQMAGALAVTLAGATLAGAGVETIGGTLAATLAGATLAASGTSLLNVTGTLAVTLEDATLAAVGSGGLVVPSDIAVVRPLAHRIPVAERAHAAAVTATPSAVAVAEADHAATVTARPHRIEA